jgi:uncharacterized protein (TIGR02453 family)
VTFSGFPEEALDFYEGLEADNSKAYWQDRRDVYERCVRQPMQELLDALEPGFGPGKMFRPYRDVRFSKDKSPYKTRAYAVVSDGAGRGGYYLEIGAAGLGTAGGYYDTAPDQVERFRQAVDQDRSGKALEKIVRKLRDGGFEVTGEQLKSRPRGYAADHPRLDLLRHRTLIAWRAHGHAPWLHTAECLDRIAADWRAIAPLDTWLYDHVGPSRTPRR